MTARYVLADVATKAAYFSLVAAAFIFVSMYRDRRQVRAAIMTDHRKRPRDPNQLDEEGS
jgi:hypothetical protein